MLKEQTRRFSAYLQSLATEQYLVKGENSLTFIGAFQKEAHILVAQNTGKYDCTLITSGFEKEALSAECSLVPRELWKLLKAESHSHCFVYYPLGILDDVILDAKIPQLFHPTPTKGGSWATLRSDTSNESEWAQALEYEVNTVLYANNFWEDRKKETIHEAICESNFSEIESLIFLYPQSYGSAFGDTLTTLILDNINRYREQWKDYAQDCNNETAHCHLTTYKLWISYVRGLNQLSTVHGCNLLLSFVIEADYPALNASISYLLVMVNFALSHRFNSNKYDIELFSTAKESLEYLAAKTDIQI